MDGIELLDHLNAARDYQELLTQVTRMLRQDPKNPALYYWHIQALYYTDQKEPAIFEGNRYLAQTSDPMWYGRIATRIGTYHWMADDHQQSYHYYHKALDKLKGTDFWDDLGNVYNNLGVYYEFRGELDKAIDCYEKSLDYKQRQGEPTYSTLINVGIVYRVSGQYSLALSTLSKAYDQLKSEQPSYIRCLCIFHTLRTCLKTEKQDELGDLLQLLEADIKALGDPDIAALGILAQGLIAASSHSIRDLVRAADLLEQIAFGDYRYARRILALRELTIIRIKELRLSDEVDVMTDIESMIQQMMDLARSNAAYPTLVDIQLLLVKLFETRQRFDAALQVLQETENMIELYQLSFLAEKVKLEKERILSEFHRIKEIMKANDRLFDNSEEKNILDYLNSIRM